MKTVSRFDVLRMAGKPVMDDNGYLICPVAATRCGIFEYRNPNGKIVRELRSREEVSKADSLATLIGVPCTNKHPHSGLLTPETAQRVTVGSIGSEVKVDGDHVLTEARVYDGPTIREILDKGRDQVSCGYKAEVDETPGVDPEFGPYDSSQHNIRYNHLAVALEHGRGGPSVRMRLDSDDNQVTEDRMKVKIDGQEFEMEDAAAKAVQKVCDSLEETRGLLKRADAALAEDDEVPAEKEDAFTPEEIAKAKRPAVRTLMDSTNKLRTKLDAVKGEVEALKGQRLDSMTPDKVAEAVASKFRVVAVAAARLDGESVLELGKLTDLELKKKVILAARPETKLDGKSEAFIDGMFETLAADTQVDGMGDIFGQMLYPEKANEVARPGSSVKPKMDDWKKPFSLTAA